jgi:uncharacterized membrane protein YfcA
MTTASCTTHCLAIRGAQMVGAAAGGFGSLVGVGGGVLIVPAIVNACP